jgi:hypothetical protein
MGATELAIELRDERDAFLTALEAVAPESMTTSGLVGEWSGRDLIAHLGYWTGHATELIHAVEQGRTDEIGRDEPPMEEVNATVARVAAQTPLDTVRRREAASVDALVSRLALVEPSLLEVVLPSGIVLAEAVRADAARHYREHAEALRAALASGARG